MRPDRAPGQAVSAEDYRAILLYAGDDTPLDGVEELTVALHDDRSRRVPARPGPAGEDRRAAEQVATAALVAHTTDKTARIRRA
ncbi:MAG: hypothetical protein WAK82_06835 [Streptosporangiaceae bacterium]